MSSDLANCGGLVEREAGAQVKLSDDYADHGDASSGMMVFFLPNSRALLPTFRTNCPDGSHFAQMGSHFAQNTTPTPYSRFPGLNLKVGKMNYSLGNLDPNWAKCLKSGQNFSRSGQKKFIHSSGPLEPGNIGTLLQSDGSSKQYKVQASYGRKWWYQKEAIAIADAALKGIG